MFCLSGYDYNTNTLTALNSKSLYTSNFELGQNVLASFEALLVLQIVADDDPSVYDRKSMTSFGAIHCIVSRFIHLFRILMRLLMPLIRFHSQNDSAHSSMSKKITDFES